jgi:hypothetical protein
MAGFWLVFNATLQKNCSWRNLLVRRQARMPAKEKPSVGRPTKYTATKPAELLKWMEKGYSFEASCGKMRISKRTGYTWMQKHVEFLHARELGDTVAQAFYEDMMLNNLVMDKDSKFNQSVFSLAMKNRFGWRDKVDLDAQVSGELVVNVSIDKTGSISHEREGS